MAERRTCLLGPDLFTALGFKKLGHKDQQTTLFRLSQKAPFYRKHKRRRRGTDSAGCSAHRGRQPGTNGSPQISRRSDRATPDNGRNTRGQCGGPKLSPTTTATCHERAEKGMHDIIEAGKSS